MSAVNGGKTVNSTGKDKNTGLFVKGNTLGGRKKGSVTQKHWQKYQDIVAASGEDLIKVVLAKALEGDLIAMRLVLDRAWPVNALQVQELNDQIEELHEIIDNMIGKSH